MFLFRSVGTDVPSSSSVVVGYCQRYVSKLSHV